MSRVSLYYIIKTKTTMNSIHQHQADILNTLVEINNDRIEGYNTAIGLLPERASIAVRSAFEEYRDQSIKFNNELKPLIFHEGENPEQGTKTSGKLFRIWMDIKAMISPSTTKSILESCAAGEEEHQKVYHKALENNIDLEENIFNIIESQSMLQSEAYSHLTTLKSQPQD